MIATSMPGDTTPVVMIGLVRKAEIKKYVERYPEYADCPPYVFVEVLPVRAENLNTGVVVMKSAQDGA